MNLAVMESLRMSPAPGNERKSCQWVASAPLPTRFGTFTTHVFRAVEVEGSDEVEKEHVALVFGEVAGVRGLPARVHSECITSEVFGSLKCDCKDQLDAAMADIARRGAGVVFYMRQEGRGIGLANKIRAYALQAEGHDTVDANRLLGLPDDQRRYDAVVAMLDHLGIPSLRLMTNNPLKVTSLERLGVEVEGRLPVVCTPNPHSAGYLETKRIRMAHHLPARPMEPLRRVVGGDAE